MAFAAYQGATRCTGSAAPGARALMAYLVANVKGARSMGIYNCRSVRGGGTRSIHSEGRALDVGMPMARGKGSKAGMDLVAVLRKDAARLGIQAIIYNRRIWSAKSPNGRAYGGVNPHYDHLHIELNRNGAAKLTLATVRAVLGGEGRPAPKPDAVGKPVLREGSEGKDVELIQRFLGIKDDGDFGPLTREAVKKYQRLRGLKPDGVVGPATWAPILKVVGK